MAKMKMHYSQWETLAGSASLPRHDGHERLADVISLTAEACGHPLSAAVAEMLADDLSRFDNNAILAALSKCRFELEGPLRLVEVLARIDDGRPGADEAWLMVPADEHDSVVWTEEIAHAWGVVQPLLEAGNVAAARSAFRTAYEKSVLDARIAGEAPKWTPSLGLDPDGREVALREAVARGRATATQAALLLGHPLGMTEGEAEHGAGGINCLH